MTREYSYGLQRISEYQEIGTTWTSSFYGYDGGGHVRTLTNTAGSVTDSYEYDAWDNKVSSTGTTPNSYLYRAEQYDSDLGLYYPRARYYNPLTGRFTSRDPEDGAITDPATLHKYLYGDGDPVNKKDLSGRAAIFEYNFNIGNRTFSIAIHGAHHYWTVALVGKLWCIHFQLLTYIAGVSGSGAKFQIPLPWCSGGGPF